jgi:hypothetical protein
MAAARDSVEAGEAEGTAGRQGSSGVEVVFPSDPAAAAPLCPHGGSRSGLSLTGDRGDSCPLRAFGF